MYILHIKFLKVFNTFIVTEVITSTVDYARASDW